MNRDLSQYFWVDLLGRLPPKPPPGSSFWAELGYIVAREWPGIVGLAVYLLLLPPLLATTLFRKAFVRMGFMAIHADVQLVPADADAAAEDDSALGV